MLTWWNGTNLTRILFLQDKTEEVEGSYVVAEWVRIDLSLNLG